VRGPRWDAAQPATIGALDNVIAAARAAGAEVTELAMPDWLVPLSDLAPVVMRREMYYSLAHERLRHADQLSANLQRFFAEGESWSLTDYVGALATIETARPSWDAMAAPYDAVLTAAAPGEAPHGLTTTGDPVLNRAWTALHGPCLTLPVGRGPAGLPLAVQLVGPRGQDWRILQAGNWLERLGSTAR
jgi:amidase